MVLYNFDYNLDYIYWYFSCANNSNQVWMTEAIKSITNFENHNAVTVGYKYDFYCVFYWF